MARDIDLTSPQWTDLIFEGKNKEYGAYEMRNDSSDRHLKALIIITIMGLAAVYLPNLIKEPEAPEPELNTNAQTTDVILTNITIDRPVPIRPLAPPAALISTTKFVNMLVVRDDLVNPDESAPTQADLSEPGVNISVATVIGEDNGTLDIRDATPPTETPADETPRTFADRMPQPVGGMPELMRWLSSNLKYPSLAAERGIQGKVIVRFVVSKDGSIGDVTIVKSLEPSCDKEALRVVKSMKNWIPGRQNEKAVSVYHTLPIQFKLQNQ